MNLPPYPKYKPSGVEWLGDVPEHWEVKRLKTSATYRVSNVDKIPAEGELPVRLCNYTDVYYNDYIVPDMEFMETTASASEVRRFALKTNDVLITKDSEEWSDIAVPAMVRQTAPDLVCGYHLAIISPSPSVLVGDFLLRCFQSCAVNQQFQIAASGVTRYGLPKSSIGEAWLPLPPISEQRTIAHFLGQRTEKLNALAEKKRALIEKLKEKRSALISRTVTKGLPPEEAAKAGFPSHPKLRPSGIDWLGNIPEHWSQVTKLGRLASRKKHSFVNGPFGSDLLTSEIIDEGVPVIYIRDISSGRYERASSGCVAPTKAKQLNFCRVDPGDVVIAKVGDPPGVAAVYPATEPSGIVTQDVIRIRVDESRVSAKYLSFFLNSSAGKGLIDQIAIESTRMRVSLGDYKASVCVMPPITEQIAIADYLDRETAKIDRMIEKVEAALQKLQEYRTALITAAVTGKIDVCSHRDFSLHVD